MFFLGIRPVHQVCVRLDAATGEMSVMAGNGQKEERERVWRVQSSAGYYVVLSRLRRVRQVETAQRLDDSSWLGPPNGSQTSPKQLP